MKIVLRKAKIVDPLSPYHLQVTDIFIENGIIQAIGEVASGTYDAEIQIENLQVSPGWVDVFAQFCDPGFEYKETLESGAAAAAAGGFTDVLVLPNTAPYIHNKAGVEYLKQKSKVLPATIHPIGGITKNGEGKELAEMYDMLASGAIAFSDGLQTVQSAGLLLKALQYIKAIDATIIQLPDDHSINPNGLMHEGVVSTHLGLPGKPPIAEEIMISRDIELAKYTGSKIHFTGISTAKAVALIAAAKAEGVAVSCSVTPYHLLFCDEDLKSYDTDLKVNPPLRTKEDRTALQQAVRDGVVDCIASHHLPRNIDEKLVEFEYAKNGMLGLQTSFAVVNTALQDLSDEQLVYLYSTNPRRLFHLPQIVIKEAGPAVLTLYVRKGNWQFEKEQNQSLSTNTPFFNYNFNGKPLGIINEDRLILNQY